MGRLPEVKGAYRIVLVDVGEAPCLRACPNTHAAEFFSRVEARPAVIMGQGRVGRIEERVKLLHVGYHAFSTWLLSSWKGDGNEYSPATVSSFTLSKTSIATPSFSKCSANVTKVRHLKVTGHAPRKVCGKRVTRLMMGYGTWCKTGVQDRRQRRLTRRLAHISGADASSKEKIR